MLDNKEYCNSNWINKDNSSCLESTPETMDTVLMIQQIAEGLIAIVSIAGNALVLYVIAKHPAFHTVTNYLIGSLAMADLLVGAIGVPAVMVNNMGWPKEFYSCLFMNCVIVILTQISIFCLLLIALERCMAVKFPVFHRHHLRAGGIVVTLSIAIAWILGTVVGMVPMFGWHLPKYNTSSDFICSFMDVVDMNYMVFFNFFGFILCPLIIMYITYGYIYYVVRTRSKRPKNKPGDVDKSRKLSRESKASRRIFLVLVFFTICWLPIHVINSVIVIAGKEHPSALLVGILLSHGNSAMNPFLYALTNRKYNEAFKRALGIKKVMAENVDLVDATQMD